MHLSYLDYALVRMARGGASLLRALGDVESSYLRRRLDNIPLEKPLFLTGLARSGTTILLEQLVRTGYFASHRYRDFPFLSVPFTWNKYLDLATAEQRPVQRAHRDRIKITADSPEAYEEPLWQMFFPFLHAPDANHRLDEHTRNEEFEDFFRDHLRKLMLVRQRDRYLSKGNYNVTRIEYLGKLFPDAEFVIPIRHPVDHVLSLVRQHRLFTDYAAKDRRVGSYLATAGHYEFGPQRQPIRIVEADGDRTDKAWDQGREHLGYAIQWSQVYRFVDDLRHRGDELVNRIQIVRYEDFCEHPRETLGRILAAVQLPPAPLESLSFEEITPSRQHETERPHAAEVWRETGLVAQLYGYAYAEERVPSTRSTSPTTQIGHESL